MSRQLRHIPLLLMLMLSASCSRDTVSCAHQDLDEHGWPMTDTVRLPLTVSDTTQAYDLAVMLRYTELYAYQNLWLFVNSTDSLSPVRCDTVMACLADDRGRWLGRRAGHYYSGYITLAQRLTFSHAGTYTFAIVHGMRDSVICGIADVGLELRKHDYGKE